MMMGLPFYIQCSKKFSVEVAFKQRATGKPYGGIALQGDGIASAKILR